LSSGKLHPVKWLLLVLGLAISLGATSARAEEDINAWTDLHGWVSKSPQDYANTCRRAGGDFEVQRTGKFKELLCSFELDGDVYTMSLALVKGSVYSLTIAYPVEDYSRTQKAIEANLGKPSQPIHHPTFGDTVGWSAVSLGRNIGVLNVGLDGVGIILIQYTRRQS